jgi:hypothetical protein
MKTALMVLCGVVLTGILVGCEATAKSDMMEPTWDKTPSYDKIMSATPEPSPIPRRTWQHGEASPEPSTVTHLPSYFDDPIVTDGDGNDTYGWTFLDPAAVAYSPARYAVNFIALPVSMVKEPPATLLCTDLDQPIAQCPVTSQPAGECEKK